MTLASNSSPALIVVVVAVAVVSSIAAGGWPLSGELATVMNREREEKKIKLEFYFTFCRIEIFHRIPPKKLLYHYDYFYWTASQFERQSLQIGNTFSEERRNSVSEQLLFG